MSARLRIHVHPGARRRSLRGWRGDGSLGLEVPEVPERGLANRAAAALVAEVLGVGGGRVSVVRGQSARAKVIEVEGLDESEIRQRIDGALAERGPSHGE